MPEPLDLDAIRARANSYVAFRQEAKKVAATAEDVTDAKIAADADWYADGLADELARCDVPALLAELDRRDTENARLRAELDAANARTAERCKQLMTARRDVEQANAERDHWQQVASGGGDCPVDGCAGELIDLETLGGKRWSRLTCSHDPEATPRADEAAVSDEFRVEFRRGTWVHRIAVVGSETAAMERVERAAVEEPDVVCEVLRVRTSRAVVWPPEGAGGEKPPESPAEPPAPLAPETAV